MTKCNRMKDVLVEEISILSNKYQPAVEDALVALKKSTDDRRMEVPMNDFQKSAQVIASRDNLSPLEALRATRRAMSPEQFEAQRYAKAEPVTTVTPLRQNADVISFEAEVDRLVASTGMSRCEAMSKARTTRPDLFAKLRGDAPDAA